MTTPATKPAEPSSEASDPKAKNKAEHMSLKTNEFRRLFGVHESESVIQDYACTLKGVIVGGRMYITQNYVGYLSKLPAKLEKIAFRKVVDVTETSSILHKYITMDTGDTKYMFGSFWTGQHYNEALCLIRYLWHNPPSYVKVAVLAPAPEKKVEEVKKSETDGQQINPFGGRVIGTAWNDDEWNKPSLSNSSSNNNTRNQSNGGQIQTTVQVDTQASKQAIRILLEAQEIGANTLNSLADQAEQIDRIESHMDNIHNNLDKSERLIRGIESLPAYIGQSLSKKKKDKVMQTPEDRRLVIQRGKAPTMDIEILCKLPNDNLVEAILCLAEDSWSCVDPLTNKPIKPEYVYKYTDIEKIILRARPEHCDIRFKPSTGKERFRLMCSYLQILTNEFILRLPKTSQGSSIQIKFEPGSTPFDYNNPRISIQPPMYTRQGPTNGFFRKEGQIKTSALLENASDETKQALDEVDADLDEISGLLGNLGNIAETTGREIVRQNEQLKKVTDRVDHANDRIHGANRRMDNLND